MTSVASSTVESAEMVLTAWVMTSATRVVRRTSTCSSPPTRTPRRVSFSVMRLSRRKAAATRPATTLAQAQDPSSQFRNPAYQGYLLLRIGFVVAPLLFGLDKFFNILVDWDKYLAPVINDIVPGNAHQAMLAVGVIE